MERSEEKSSATWEYVRYFQFPYTIYIYLLQDDYESMLQRSMINGVISLDLHFSHLRLKVTRACETGAHADECFASVRTV